MSLLAFAFALAVLLGETAAAPRPIQFATLVSQLRKPLYVDHGELAISEYRLSRDILQARWSETWYEDLPCSEPKNKGLVRKVGSGTQSPTLWLSIQESDMYINEKLPIYVGCQVYISEKWRFIYIRQPKSSSTAVITAVKTQLCGLAAGKGDCELDEFRLATEEDINSRIWEDFFVFTFVRNPWTRMLSAYNMFQQFFLRRRTGEDGKVPGEECGLTFEEFAENTNAMRQLCPEEQCCVFIKARDYWLPHFLDEHISDQSHCVFLPGGESMVDFIGASESIDADWPAVVEQINERCGSAFEAEYVGNPNGHGAPGMNGIENACGLDNVRSMFNESTLYSIASQYSMDVINYGYM